jgi:1,2-diacylglycerol-3-alpha-glucose alpha-1,2-glucosyltransferase
MKLPVLVRDIPIYRKWLTDGVNVYKAGDIGGFERKITAILENEAPSLTDAGYRVAEERDLKIIGGQLAELYSTEIEELPYIAPIQQTIPF